MSIVLRPFQATGIEHVKSAIRAGNRRVLLCIPTGGGKTLTAGAIIQSAIAKGSRVLFVAHRKELIDQSVTALYRLGVHPVGVIRAGDPRKDLSRLVQVASIQTLARRPHLDPPPDIVVIDECHRALAEGYQKHLYAAYPRAVFLGLSATPCRTDGKPLAGAFDVLIQAAQYSELIAGGFIDAPLVYSTPILPDLATVRTAGGEFSQEDLEEAVNRSALIGNVGAEWQRRSEGRLTVVFAVSVAHSLALREMFRGLGATAEHLDGTTPEVERAAILARLERGETQVVCNVGVLTEGWDCPPVKCGIVARPTKSLALWMQMAGRFLRPWGGVVPLLLDHGGNVDRFQLSTGAGLPHSDREWSLESKPKASEAAPSRMCPDCFGYIAAASRNCPLCGVEIPVKVAPEREAVEPVLVDLALRSLAEDGNNDPEKLAVFREEHARARAKGWKPGAVMHRYRERVGDDPPRAWYAALKRDAKNDVVWKGRIAKRAELAGVGP